MANPEQEIPIEFTLKPDLLDRINRALKELGSSAKYKKAPKYKPGFEHLRDKTVVIVDDVYGVLEGFIPEMMVASNGNADFIHFTNQSKEELVRQIMEKNPDIVFLDYNLSDELKEAGLLLRFLILGRDGRTGRPFYSSDHTFNQFNTTVPAA